VANSSVDGLVSGLSTSSLISQLVQAESAPQQALQAKVDREQKVVLSLRAINTRMATLETAAGAVGNATTWQAVKATSSSDAVAASSTSGASTGSLTFDVTSLARGQVSTAIVAASGAVTTANTVDITIGGTTTQVDVSADKSAQGVVNAINAKGIAVKAALVTASNGSTVLQLTGTKTGTANAFSVSNFDPTVSVAVTATDAQITVGNPASGGYTVSSATNTFTNLMAGTTLTANRIQAGVTVDVRSDVDGLASKIQAMVDAANGTLSEISRQSSYDATTKTGQPLAGNATARQLSQSVLSTVPYGLSATDYPTLTDRTFKQIGVELDKSGKLVFNKDKFAAAYAANPGTAQTVATALGKNLEKLADGAQSMLTDAVNSHDNFTRGLKSQIANWDARLNARREALQRQFSGLEKALGKLKDQSSWLAGQIAGLPSSS
jgi:flagellar hook-associated protein 2